MFQSFSSNSETLTAVRTFGHFQSFFSKIWLKTPLHKSVAMETKQNLDHQLYQFFTSHR